MFGNFHKLLGDGRCAGNDPTVSHAGDQSAAGGEPIDSVMRKKAFVFRGENGGDDVRRHFFERELVAESFGHARFAERDAVAIQQRDALDRRLEQCARNRN